MEIDLTGVSVQIGIPVNSQICPQTTLALVNTCIALKGRGLPFNLNLHLGCSIVEQARCFVADDFLRSEDTHLFMIDADVEWKAEDFFKVLALTTKMECVAAIYPAKREPETWMLNHSGVTEINEYGCMPVHGLGLGFCCVQRKIMTRLAQNAPKVRFHDRPHPIAKIFRCDEIEGWFRGEDMAFFADVRALGYQVNLDPNIEIAHHGPKRYAGSFLEAIRSNKIGPKAKENE